MSESAYPLLWPSGWPRTETNRRRRAQFGALWSVNSASQELFKQLRTTGAVSPVLSTNVPLRRDGLPYSNQANPIDTGAAAYFTLRKQRIVLACDKWDRVEHNIRAIAAHVEALRAQERWGVGTMERAFTGYAALEAPMSFREVLGLDPGPYTEDDVKALFRDLVKGAHPDAGGDPHEFQRICRARDEALEVLGVRA